MGAGFRVPAAGIRLETQVLPRGRRKFGPKARLD
jgi:hypothetical protein